MENLLQNSIDARFQAFQANRKSLTLTTAIIHVNPIKSVILNLMIVSMNTLLNAYVY